MAPLKTALKVVTIAPLLGGAFIYQRTRHSHFVPISPDDAIYSSPAYLKNNPHRNPATQDLCVRRVPIAKIKPGLVDTFLKAQAEEVIAAEKKGKDGVEGKEKDGKQAAAGNKGWGLGGWFGGAGKSEAGDGKGENVVGGAILGANLNKVEEEASGEGYGLVEHFCAGIWSGLGYVYQRHYLSKKYQHLPDRTTSPSQLWSREELKASTYPVGTQITDHFEVVEKRKDSIVVRCGDSPLNSGLRDSDGLFEMGVKVFPAEGLGGAWGAGKEGEVEFSLKSVFYKGLTKSPDGSTDGPMPLHIEYLHKLYTKIWMESAIYNVMA